MIFFLVYIFLIFGLLMASVGGFLPVPITLQVMFIMMGSIISIIGIFILQGRAIKTGAVHLLEFGKPNTIIWFYVHRDGTVHITPSVRDIGSQLYSKELDAQIHDLKSYRLFDHSIRFVPSGVGHSIDLDIVLYMTLLKRKFGFDNIREARKGFSKGFLSKLPIPGLSSKVIEGAERIGEKEVQEWED